MVAELVADKKIGDMDMDMVADMEVYKVANMAANMEAKQQQKLADMELSGSM